MLTVMLTLASLWCIAMALRPPSRRRVRAAIPLPLRMARRLPAPPQLVAALGGAAQPQVLDAAGLSGAVSPQEVPRARVALAFTALLLAIPGVVFPPLLLLAAVLAGTGWVSPGLTVGWAATRRRAHVARQLPDVLDLLGVCVEAGMSLEPALRTVAARLGGPLGDEIQALLDDLALGATRRDAYRAMAGRVGLTDLDVAVGALLTADELGTPLSGVLADQAVSLRAVAAQRARDRASRAAPKIQLVVAMLMVPAVLILVVTVMGLELMRRVGPVLGGMG